ncbi:unnamed protein product, partial [Ectocarpus fasciculatus]
QDSFTRTLYENEKIYFLFLLRCKCSTSVPPNEIIVVKGPFIVVCASF